MDKPVLSSTPMVRTFSKDPAKQVLLRDHISEMLLKQAIEPVVNPLSPGFYSRIFLVPKRTGGFRPVIDLSVLNLYLKPIHFKMETAESIRSSLTPGMWTFSIDLKDAFFHIPIHPSSRKFLRIEFQGKTYQFRALPFGVKIAPWLFTTVFKEVKVMALARGVPIHQYMDDWLGKAMDPELCRTRSSVMVALCSELGIKVNLAKSDLVPKQVFDFLGYRFDLVRYLVFPTSANLLKVSQVASLLLQKDRLTAQMWQSVIGVLASQEKLVPFGRLHVRPLQHHLLDLWNPLRGNPKELIPVPSALRSIARWWMDPLNVEVGLPVVLPQPSARIYTDASLKGWGAHFDGRVLSGIWSEEETRLHINVLEMRAVLYALRLLDFSRGENILVSTDNSTVVAYINHQGGTRSLSLWNETLELFVFLMHKGLSLRAVHIPGHMNVIADQLSRAGQTLPTEWSLHPEVVRDLFRQWGKPHVDLFATRYNHKCDLFVSPVPDPLALATDALSFDWDHLWAYAYPPPQILTKVLRKLRSHSCQIMLIAPDWPKQSWYSDLLELSVEDPVRLPLLPRLLKQPHREVFHRCPEILNLHAWLLKGRPCEQGGSLGMRSDG